MKPPIRWGILGTGQIARQFADALAELPDASLHAVASRQLGNAQAFAAACNQTSNKASNKTSTAIRCYGDYQSLVQDADVDVIYVATPHAMHTENTLLALRAGKPVLCEKPFTMNARQAGEVMAVAREKKLFLMEAMWSRFMPAMLEVKRLLAAGEIGKPKLLQADFGFASDLGPQHRLLDPALGGGALLDIGIYPLSMASYLLGEVVAVQAIAELGSTGVDEQTSFMLTHKDGGLSSCLCSIKAATPTELFIAGDKGNIRLHAPFYRCTELTITQEQAEPRTISLPVLGNGYTHQAIETMRCLRAGLTESPVMPLDETLALMGWMDSMRRQFGLSYAEDKI
ncbi:Gfo/Idh/MocA family protein [Undibacterium terreum]|uniref:Oxidoreductase n=1 Tax=Undibacterium terreum TaxID=1224302 RepID=A0A916XG68_9BURK|nr:Gfo/Idh/MocA family oxidoreductase [Undibacterium terreum]GGC70974.1 oxidoreductase [Undibacterium terreum]